MSSAGCKIHVWHSNTMKQEEGIDANSGKTSLMEIQWNVQNYTKLMVSNSPAPEEILVPIHCWKLHEIS